MRRSCLLFLLLLSWAGATPAPAQMGQDMARTQGEDIAKSVRDSTSDSILATGAENDVPGFGGTTFSESSYVDDVDGLMDAGEFQRSTNSSYGTVINPDRPEFDPTTIDLSSAESIAADPDALLGTDTEITGSTGSCEALTGGDAAASTYYETCNMGAAVENIPLTCSVKQSVKVDLQHRYSCQRIDIIIPAHEVCDTWKPKAGCVKRKIVPDEIIETISTCGAAAGDSSCRSTGSTSKTESDYWSGDKYTKFSLEDDFGTKVNYRDIRVTDTEYSCGLEHIPTTKVQSQNFYYTEFFIQIKPRRTRPVASSKTFWFAKAEEYLGAVGTGATSVLDESDCIKKTKSLTCTNPVETCIDSSPQTRMINGIAVTHTCWEWERRYDCAKIASKNDCCALDANPKCTFDHEECLDDPQLGACQVKDLVYKCIADAPHAEETEGTLCAGDLYCINGECTKVERQASSEFKDAMVAVHALGEMKDQFDPDTLTLFNGEKAGCHKPVFGLVNCCAGKSSGLLSTAVGGAALAGGLPAITALATPFLSYFLCSPNEMILDVKDRMGLCHYVGTYCSSKTLGICTSKRKNYCCFESKLARILQEQGRIQLGKDWGKAKKPECQGFLVEEFQQLDLSQMDFTEVYSEFMEAAKVPDAVETSIEIQSKIEEYYELHAKK